MSVVMEQTEGEERTTKQKKGEKAKDSFFLDCCKLEQVHEVSGPNFKLVFVLCFVMLVLFDRK